MANKTYNLKVRLTRAEYAALKRQRAAGETVSACVRRLLRYPNYALTTSADTEPVIVNTKYVRRRELAGLLSTIEFQPSLEHPEMCLPHADAILARWSLTERTP